MDRNVSCDSHPSGGLGWWQSRCSQWQCRAWLFQQRSADRQSLGRWREVGEQSGAGRWGRGWSVGFSHWQQVKLMLLAECRKRATPVPPALFTSLGLASASWPQFHIQLNQPCDSSSSIFNPGRWIHRPALLAWRTKRGFLIRNKHMLHLTLKGWLSICLFYNTPIYLLFFRAGSKKGLNFSADDNKAWLQNTYLHLCLLSRQRDVEDIQGLFRLLKDGHTTNRLDLLAVLSYCTETFYSNLKSNQENGIIIYGEQVQVGLGFTMV